MTNRCGHRERIGASCGSWRLYCEKDIGHLDDHEGTETLTLEGEHVATLHATWPNVCESFYTGEDEREFWLCKLPPHHDGEHVVTDHKADGSTRVVSWPSEGADTWET